MSDSEASNPAYRSTSSYESGGLPSSTEQVSELILQVAGHDRDAFTRLYHATAPKLLGTILRILHHRGWAEDVLQEVYIRVWKKAHQFDPGKASPITWLVTIARNLAIDRVRSQSTGVRVDEEELNQVPSAQPDGSSTLERWQSAQQLNHCLDQLEKNRRDMVRLAYLDGWSREELSSHFRQPVNTVKTWLRRALKQLKGCLTS